MNQVKNYEPSAGGKEMLDNLSSPEGVGYSYAGYVALGGRIDEENYTRIMQEARENPIVVEENVKGLSMGQTAITAEISGVSLDAIRDSAGVDPRAIYKILRHDKRPEGVEHHHGSMSDQALLVEALRMLEQGDAVGAIIAKHPHIAFK